MTSAKNLDEDWPLLQDYLVPFILVPALRTPITIRRLMKKVRRNMLSVVFHYDRSNEWGNQYYDEYTRVLTEQFLELSKEYLLPIVSKDQYYDIYYEIDRYKMKNIVNFLHQDMANQIKAPLGDVLGKDLTSYILAYFVEN